jgi:hypothetical protein
MGNRGFLYQEMRSVEKYFHERSLHGTPGQVSYGQSRVLSAVVSFLISLIVLVAGKL